MATNFPGAIDSFTNPTSGDTLDSPSHAAQHANINDAMVAVQTRLGTGSDPIGTWTAFTPSWSNFNPGNAVENWSYTIVNDIMIVTGITTLGTTSSMGTAPYMLIPDSRVAARWATGVARMREDGVATRIGNVEVSGPGDTNMNLTYWTVVSNQVRAAGINSTTPFNWGTGDYITFTIAFDIT